MAIEVTGQGIGLNQALDCMRTSGRIALLGCTRDSDFSAFKLIRGGRLNFQKMISAIHSPMEAQAVYDRLINSRNFPIGVLFDRTTLEN